MLSLSTSSKSVKSVKLVSQIYKVNGIHVCPSHQSKVSLVELEDKVASLLFEVEQGLVEFYSDFKKDIVDDMQRLQQKWALYNSLLKLTVK